MVRSTRKAWASVAVGLIVVALSACKASEKVVVDSVETSSWVRCALRAIVRRRGGRRPADAQYGAATEAWRDYFCVNEDTGALWWDRLDVYARKYHGSYLCETSATYWTTTSRSVSVSDSAVRSRWVEPHLGHGHPRRQPTRSRHPTRRVHHAGGDLHLGGSTMTTRRTLLATAGRPPRSSPPVPSPPRPAPTIRAAPRDGEPAGRGHPRPAHRDRSAAPTFDPGPGPDGHAPRLRPGLGAHGPR